MSDRGTQRSAARPALSVDVVKRLNSFTLQARFEVPGGFTMLLGPSGGGKTTLLNCIAGLMRPDAGRVAIGARALFDSAARIDLAPARRGLGYLFQDVALFPHLSLAENVSYGVARMPAARRRSTTMALLESFHIAHLAQRKPAEISGGERQRAALARSLATEPGALLLDEPLAALDRATKSTIIDDLRSWNGARGIPILFVTHSPEEAFALGERVIVIEAGQILAQGMPHEVLTSPRHETIAQIVGFENVFDATIVALHENQGTMFCRLQDSTCTLEVPLTRADAGAPVRIAIRAGDIMIAAERPHGLSARNSVRGQIRSLRREGARVVLEIDAGAAFQANVTPSAVDELGLVPGRQIWMVIKTYSCNMVNPRD